MDTGTTVGFIGVGSLTKAMVQGLLGGDDGAEPGRPAVVLSPRGAANAAELSTRFPQVTVAETNAEVIDKSDVVVIAVLPSQLAGALEGTTFHGGQTVVSVLAGVNVESVRAVLGRDDVPVARAIPLPPVAERRAVVPVFPDNPVAVGLFGRMGDTLVVEDEALLVVLSAATGACTGLLQYVAVLTDWVVEQGLPRESAEPFIRAVIASLAPALQETDVPLGEVISSHETPGGLNEQLRREFFDTRTTAALTDALDGTHRRAAGG